MPSIIEQSANEKGTIVFVVSLSDSLGIDYPLTGVTSAKWQLTKTDGSVINNRSFDNSDIPSNGVIALSGDDLAIFEGETCFERRIGIQIVYDSTYGSDLTATDELIFYIQNLVTIE